MAWDADVESGIAAELQQVLRAQASFARDYSPLSASLCDALSGWMSAPADAAERIARHAPALAGDVDAATIAGELRAFVARTLGFFGNRRWSNDLQPTLKVAASLHSYVLEGDPRADAIAPYFCASATSGRVDAARGHSPRRPDEQFEAALWSSWRSLGDLLMTRAEGWRVQTNETSRGLAWLLPSVLVGATEVHLLELGSSAGLNLYAEQRSYALEYGAAADGAGEATPPLVLGRGEPAQFRVRVEGPRLQIPGALAGGPEVLSRVGGDAHPLDLSQPGAALTLRSCIWGDQCGRLERTNEAIALHQRALGGEVSPPAHVRPMLMPGDVSDFLAAALPPRPEVPAILFNTCVTAYLSDVEHRATERAVREFARSWTLRHHLPWMWVRFEPVRAGAGKGPELGWCMWRVDMWVGGRHRSYVLGWAHPHLVQIKLGDGAVQLQEAFRE